MSETFIAQELLGLQEAGLAFEIVSLRAPYDAFHHPMHDQITAAVHYLPERLRDEPLRCLRGLANSARGAGFWTALAKFLRDLLQDPSRLRVRSFGQALVLASEIQGGGKTWLYAHFAHTPTSVARYAATILGAPFSISAHAKDIWTSPERDLAQKLNEAHWTVTCTRVGRDYLARIAPGAKVHLCYHGLDLSRFPPSSGDCSRRDGTDPDDPVRILSVGRAVPKKGYDTLLRALAALPADLNWRFDHIGGGTELPRLAALAESLGSSDRVTWHGPKNQIEVLKAYRSSDIFTLASHETGDNDRDGLPNVLVEAASQSLACVSTRFSAIPELLTHEQSGLLVPPEDAGALSDALALAAKDPDLRSRLGRAAFDRVRDEFDARPSLARLREIFESGWNAPDGTGQRSR